MVALFFCVRAICTRAPVFPTVARSALPLTLALVGAGVRWS